MILYHFTSATFLPSIQKEGLTRGEVPLSPRQVMNGVWLTTDPNPEGHGLSNGEELSESTIRELQSRGLLAKDIPTDKPLRWADKRSARITIVLPSTDRALKHWPKWSRRRLHPDWYSALTDAGGGKQKANSWYVCFRTISPAEFKSVEVLRDPS